MDECAQTAPALVGVQLGVSCTLVLCLLSQYVTLCVAVLSWCGDLCMYMPFILSVTRCNVLGNKISEDVFILKKTEPHILVLICCYLYLAEKKLRVKRELTAWCTAAAGGCASAVRKVSFHAPFLLFVLLVWLLWRLE